MPRATTAACDVIPPWAVSTPAAWMSPWMSSGVVSQRTRIDALAGLPALLGRVRVEHDRARGGAGRGIQAARGDVDLRVRVDHRVQELVELAGVDARDRLLARDEPLVDHLGRDAQRGGRRALPRARLQEVQRPLLDRELDVLQVAVVRLEPVERVDELLERLGHALAHAVDRLGRADPGDDVLALRVREELAVEPPLAGRGVAREADAGAGALAAVAEDHLHDVHRGAEVVRDVVRAAVDLRARRVPRVEDGAVRAAQLLARVLRERAARSPPRRCALNVVDELAEVVGGELDVLRRRLAPPSRSVSACSKRCPSTPSTTSPYIWMSRRYESSAKRGLPVDAASPSTATSFSPRLRIVSIIPGIETAAPERTETSSGFPVVAEALPGARLEGRDVLVDLGVEARRAPRRRRRDRRGTPRS